MKKVTLLSTILTLNIGLWALSSSAQVCFTSQNYSAGSEPYSIVTGDFNGDGKKDLVSTNANDNSITLRLGDGAGNFGAASTAAVGNYPISIVTADFNGDTKADVVTANYNGNSLSILFGNGSGGFGTPATLAVAPKNPQSVTVGDFNGDGKKDLAVSYYNAMFVSVFIGNGTGGFAASVDYNSDYNYQYSIANSDVNADGKADLIVTSEDDGSLGILLGNGDGTFQAIAQYSTSYCPTFASWGDFNSDGKKDIVTSSDCGGLSLLKGNGDGTFQSQVTFSASSSESNTVADFNGDGNLDVAVAYMYGNEVQIFLGDGAGNFASPVNYNSVGSEPYSIITSDFNGDGKPDLATANYNDNNVSVLLNSIPPTVAANASATSLCAGSSVVLSGTGAGVTDYHTITYDIHQSDLDAQYWNCSSTSWYGYPYYWGYTGFHWTGTEPAGSTILSVSVKANPNYSSMSGSYNIWGQLNGNNTNNYITTPYNTSCSNSDNVVSYSVNSGYYNSNSYNYFRFITGYYDVFGLCTNSSWSGSSGVYARVTVTYYTNPLPSYVWSGGVTDGIEFTPNSTATYTVTGTNLAGCSNSAAVTITVNPVITNTFVATDASCTCNGAVNVTTDGGTSPFTYLWSNGGTTSAKTALCAGTYTLTTTDAQGCTKAATTTINSSPSMGFSVSSTDVTCQANGTASVTVSGGTAPYTYSWSNGKTTSAITGLVAGTYTLTATDSYSTACANVTTVTITSNPLLSFNAAKTNATCTASCNGGATVTVTGGTGPYTYAWAPSGGTTSAATGLCSGTTYTVSATDANGCTNVGSTVAIGTTPMMLSFVNTNANCSTSCNGKSSVSVSGGAGPYTYAWSNGGTTSATTGLCGGSSYTVTVTANGCSQSAITTVASNPLVAIASFTDTPTSCSAVCNGASVASAIGGVGPYTYVWSNGVSAAATTGLCADSLYTVTVKDANGCSSASTHSVAVSGDEIYVDYMDVEEYAACASKCNGVATAYVYGGSGSYTYSWSNGGSNATATGLCGSDNGITYTFTVTDAVGCMAKDSTNATVYLNNAIYFYTSTDDASCVSACNGDADIYAVYNAEGPYTYLWSTGATTSSVTGLCGSVNGTNYTVTITDSLGCSITDATSNSIYLNSPLYFYESTWDATCSAACDGVAAIYEGDIYNGDSPYTYMWSNGNTTSSISNLCVGYYNGLLTVTDANGCHTTQDISIDDAGNGVYVDYWSFMGSIQNTFCNSVCTGSAIGYVYSGTAPYTYMWSNGATTASITGLCAGDYTFTVTDASGCSDYLTFTINTNSSVNFSRTNTSSTCDQVCNGTAMAYSPYGGAFPYSYKWSNGSTTSSITGICGSDNGITYTVTVTDANGCTKDRTTTVYANNYMSISNWGWDASCDGICDGKDSLRVNNGIAPYTYIWSNGATTQVVTGLCGDYNYGIDYAVTVTDSMGCQAATDRWIYTNDPPSVSVMTTDVFCNGQCNGTAYANVSGGAFPYQYMWSNGATTATVTGLCAGSYNLNVKDANGCVSSDAFNVYSFYSAMSISVSNESASCKSMCDGKATATVYSGGTAPYVYQWLPSGGSAATATGLCAGTYTVNITDANGCSMSSVTTIDEPAALVTNVTVTQSTVCVSGGSAKANVAGGTTPYNYAWNPTGQITQTAVALANGTYSVLVTDDNGCTSSGVAVISCTEGVHELSAEGVFTVYPNPTTGLMMVTNNGTISGIQIENVLGQVIYSTSNERRQTSINVDITSQPTGIYVMRIKAGENSYSQKIVKE